MPAAARAPSSLRRAIVATAFVLGSCAVVCGGAFAYALWSWGHVDFVVRNDSPHTLRNVVLFAGDPGARASAPPTLEEVDELLPGGVVRTRASNARGFSLCVTFDGPVTRHSVPGLGYVDSDDSGEQHFLIQPDLTIIDGSVTD